MKKPLIGVVMGSDSDLTVMGEAGKVLEEFNISYEMTIVSAHRTPNRLAAYAKNAATRGLKVIIAGAGGAAHLPGMCAAYSVLPVIGVPVQSKSLQGMDSLLSIVQMPPGVPVATVAINGAKNAALLAIQILSVSDERMQKAISTYKDAMKNQVEKKAKKLESIGYEKYSSQT
jgi:5-(carboxyamino)imidazole ribonucleotide mutase